LVNNAIFFTTSVLSDARAGDSIYTKQVYETLKKNSRLNVDFYSLNSSSPQISKIKAIIFAMLFLPIMWRGTLNVTNFCSVIFNIFKTRPEIIIVDHFRTAWISLLFKFLSPKTFVWHVSHNLESGIISTNFNENNMLVNALYKVELPKLRFFEKHIFSRVNVVSFITDEDMKKAEKVIGVFNTQYLYLTPYAENVEDSPSKKVDVKYDSIIIGSFHWRLKRNNLMSFLESKPSDINDSKILIAGSMPKKFKELTEKTFSFVTVINDFESIDEFDGVAKSAICPDLAGGGFKLKALDYLKLGLHIIAFEGQLNGVDCKKCSISLVKRYQEMWRAMDEIGFKDVISIRHTNKTYLKNYHSKENMKSKIFDIFK
jgi:hypothetical protein